MVKQNEEGLQFLFDKKLTISTKKTNKIQKKEKLKKFGRFPRGIFQSTVPRKVALRMSSTGNLTPYGFHFFSMRHIFQANLLSMV